MGFAREATGREPFAPAAPDGEPPPSLELVPPRRTRRNRTVAILKIPRLWPATQLGRATATANAVDVATVAAADGLDAFGSEVEPRVEIRPAVEPAKPKAGAPAVEATVVAKWLVVVLLSAGVAVAGLIGYQRRFSRIAPTGRVTIETTPAGLDVVLAGKSLGKTPLTTTMAPGVYEVQVGTAPETRTLTLNVAAGGSVLQHVEFAAATSPTGTAPGGLRVQTEPAHLPVSVDGVARGSAPVAIDQLPPGEHDIAVKTSSGVIHRKVKVASRCSCARGAK